MEKATKKVTFILFSLIWLCIILINLLRSEATQVSTDIAQRVLDSGLVSKAEIRPNKIFFRLKERINIRLEIGQVRTQAIEIVRSNSTTNTERKLLEDGLGVVVSESDRPLIRGDLVFLAFFIAGIGTLVVKARKDRRHGSIRQKIADLKSSLDRGEIEQEEFSRKVNDLTPYL
tara:strand:- start:2 stop:523 length:522 start_codon:yes stop_codon:yes gene_type:complete